LDADKNGEKVCFPTSTCVWNLNPKL
jgi:hypothetical protein